jgi:hypothetical protein
MEILGVRRPVVGSIAWLGVRAAAGPVSSKTFVGKSTARRLSRETRAQKRKETTKASWRARVPKETDYEANESGDNESGGRRRE